MDWYKIFYFLTVSEGMKSVFNVASNIFTAFAIITFIVYAILTFCVMDPDNTSRGNDEASYKYWKGHFGKFFWWSATFCFITWTLWVATPSKKDCLMIIAGGAVGNFLTTDTSARHIPSDITSFLHLSLKNEVSKLSVEEKKQIGLETPKERLIDAAKKLSKDELIRFLEADTTIAK